MSKTFQDPLHRRKPRGKGEKKYFKKLLVLAAVILFALVFGKDFTKSFGNGQETEDTVLVGDTQTEAVVGAGPFGLLGGPFSSLEQILFQSAQGAIDFSADDAEEDSDMTFIQDNSVIATNCPAPEAGFGNYKKEAFTYIVKEGDNPEKIALTFGINTYTLLWANNLKDGDIIKPGQELIVLPINGVRVKVVSGDTIASLAKKYQGKTDEIIVFNALPEDGGLVIGEYIIIPGGEPLPAPKAKTAPKTSAPKYASSVQQAGWLIIPTTGRNWRRIHSYNGVDISNPCGTPIYAAAAGSIILSDGSGWNGGYGKYIKIQHPNGVITLYGHLSSLAVVAGESVAQGQYIGAMGTTGRSTGCHLHFEVRGSKNPLTR